MTSFQTRHSWHLALAASCCALLLHTGPSTAQEVSGLQAALALEKVLVEAIARSEKSVVAIARGAKQSEAQLRNPDYIPREFGTGVVIDRAGLILTNEHVLGDVKQSSYAVWTGGRAYSAEVLGTDPWLDLAVLKIDADNLTPITLGDAKGLKKGQIVIALGNPYAIAKHGQVSASWGIIANLARKAGPRPNPTDPQGIRETLHHFGTLIQTDAKLNLGTSGGALINLHGQMIGLTTSLAALAGYEKSAGYAIPMDDTLKRSLENLKTGQRVAYGFLGVEPKNLQDAARSGGQQGILLRQVVMGTPAERFGLRSGDLLTHVDDHPLQFADDLILQIGKLPVQQIVRLTIQRKGREIQRNVKLSKMYRSSLDRAIVTAQEPKWRGMRVDYSTAVPLLRYRESIHQVDPAGCVVISDVEQGTPAWRAELRRWTFISHVDGRRISSPKEFYAAVSQKRGPVRVRIASRVGKGSTRTVQP